MKSTLLDKQRSRVPPSGFEPTYPGQTWGSDNSLELSDREYEDICNFVLNRIGIDLGKNKKSLVTARLASRLRHFNLTNMHTYLDQVLDGRLTGEQQVLLDKLTTNETYMFREPAHFEFLKNVILKKSRRSTDNPVRIWSAACSTGEEVFSLAMTAHDVLGDTNWNITGSDICSQVLSTASSGIFSTQRSDNIPPSFLKEYCKRGINEQSGKFLLQKHLRDQLQFKQINLIENTPPGLGQFDVIFLRNVLIYFNDETRLLVLRNITRHLKEGGYFFVSLTETITNQTNDLIQISPSIYQKVSRTPPKTDIEVESWSI